MPTWVTHMMIADKVLEEQPQLDRRGFCVGNIAPDCNIQNEDWTIYTPSREKTHWMQSGRKAISDADAFCKEYIVKRRAEISEGEEYSFLLGYYSHLITDAAFTRMIREEERVAEVWARIRANEELVQRLKELETQSEELLPKTWDTVKRLISKEQRMRELESLEAEYLQEHPKSGYITDIMPLKEFPDYIDYLPQGSIAFKIPYLGSYIPRIYEEAQFIGVSREEFAGYVRDTVDLVCRCFRKMELV